jgi:hypothetical protein
MACNTCIHRELSFVSIRLRFASSYRIGEVTQPCVTQQNCDGSPEWHSFPTRMCPRSPVSLPSCASIAGSASSRFRRASLRVLSTRGTRARHGRFDAVIGTVG